MPTRKVRGQKRRINLGAHGKAMLSQIALYRTIPAMLKDVRGFMDETNERLAGTNSREFRLVGKYRDRLERAERALRALKELRSALDE